MSEEGLNNQETVLTECSLGEQWLMTDLLSDAKAEQARRNLLMNSDFVGKKYVFVAFNLIDNRDPLPADMGDFLCRLDFSGSTSESERVYVIPRDDLVSALEVFNVAENYHWSFLFSSAQEFRQVVARMIKDIENSINLEVANITESDVIIEFSPAITLEDAEMIEAICLNRSDGLDTTFGLEGYFEGDPISTRIFREKKLYLWWD